MGFSASLADFLVVAVLFETLDILLYLLVFQKTKGANLLDTRLVGARPSPLNGIVYCNFSLVKRDFGFQLLSIRVSETLRLVRDTC